MRDYETIAGMLSPGDTKQKIQELMIELQRHIYALGHYEKLNDEFLLGQGYLAIGQMMREVAMRLNRLGQGKLH